MNLNCAGKLISSKSAIVMGIVNVTPDSFYDGNPNSSSKDIQIKIEHMITQGADIIDIGGMSTRPGAEIVSPQMEWDRISSSIDFLKLNFPDTLISVDTIHSETAVKALDVGAHIINDISGGSYDVRMHQSIAPYHPAYITMHMRGTPATMQSVTTYDDMILEIISSLKNNYSKALSAGLTSIVIDPGFGFSKTIDQNYKLLNHLNALKLITPNILVGLSRKSMIYKVLGLSPKDSLNGTSILHMKALQQGAKILRVHDVREAKEAITLFEKLSVNK